MSFCIANSAGGASVSLYHFSHGPERPRTRSPSLVQRAYSNGCHPVIDQIGSGEKIEAPNKNVHGIGSSVPISRIGHASPGVPAGASVTAPMFSGVPPLSTVDSTSSSTQGMNSSSQPPAVAKHLAAMSQRTGSLAAPVHSVRASFGSITMSPAPPKLDERHRRHTMSPFIAPQLLPPDRLGSASPTRPRQDNVILPHAAVSPSRNRGTNVSRWHGTSSPPLAPRESEFLGSQPNGTICRNTPFYTPRAKHAGSSGPGSSSLGSNGIAGGSSKFPFGGSNILSLISPRYEANGGLERPAFSQTPGVPPHKPVGAAHMPFRQGASLTIGPCRSPPRRAVQPVSLDVASLPIDAAMCTVTNAVADEKVHEEWQRSFENARLDNLLWTAAEALNVPAERLSPRCLDANSAYPQKEGVSAADTEVLHSDNADYSPEKQCSEVTDTTDAPRRTLEDERMDQPIVYPCKDEYTWAVADVLPPTDGCNGFIFSHNNATLVFDDDGLRSTATFPPDESSAELDDESMLRLLTPEDVRLRYEGGRTLFHLALSLG